MRCAGAAGRHHYFHKGCLGGWIGACTARGAAPTCPVCRGPVQVHISGLSALLEGPQADALGAEEKSALRVLLDRARATLNGGGCADSDEWVEPFHPEELAAAGAVTAAAAAGFYAGYSDGPGTGAIDVALLVAQDPYVQVAGGVGYVTGLVARGVEAALSDA
ncbi:unnamed protein product [Prorocentrum cordatum]|uniref:RING-type domain-containing protein n=2 Tax=Prorocentrum cordatum TaxID=2364126 RepID=A0ABN9QE13_9DINO|nr:unnamed protein product [Polarella glacialis]